MGLTKPELDKNFVFLTLTTEEARDLIFKDGLTFNHKRLQINVTRDRGTGNPSEIRISTILVANNLPQRETQTTIIRAIKNAFDSDNIVDISFGTNNQHYTDKQSGWCHIQYLNTAVYTEWLHKSAYILHPTPREHRQHRTQQNGDSPSPSFRAWSHCGESPSHG